MSYYAAAELDAVDLYTCNVSAVQVEYYRAAVFENVTLSSQIFSLRLKELSILDGSSLVATPASPTLLCG